MNPDPEEYRQASLDQWQRSAEGWGAHAQRIQEMAGPVSHWLVEAIHPQPGQTVLELAAGPGETGFLAAELVRPGGRLISSDFADPMLDVARARARELGLDNVDFRRLDGESLDLETASVDGVLCRWGYMLMADPGSAFRETRRVLRPGGRVALAAFAGPEENPWVSLLAQEVRAQLDQPEPDPAQPGMFSFAQPGRIEGLLEDAGFVEHLVEPLDLTFTYASPGDWWDTQTTLGRPLADLLERMESQQRDEVRAAVERRAQPFATPEGRVAFPARALLAVASA